MITLLFDLLPASLHYFSPFLVISPWAPDKPPEGTIHNFIPLKLLTGKLARKTCWIRRDELYHSDETTFVPPVPPL